MLNQAQIFEWLGDNFSAAPLKRGRPLLWWQHSVSVRDEIENLCVRQLQQTQNNIEQLAKKHEDKATL